MSLQLSCVCPPHAQGRCLSSCTAAHCAQSSSLCALVNVYTVLKKSIQRMCLARQLHVTWYPLLVLEWVRPGHRCHQRAGSV